MTLPGSKVITNVWNDALVSDSNNSNCSLARWAAVDSISIGGTTYQTGCYWDTNEKLVIVTRVHGGAWKRFVYDGTGSFPNIPRGTRDFHNTANLCHDPDGYIHICYDMHNDPLNYRKSTLPVTTFAGVLTAEISMVGTNETEVSYPSFFRDPADSKLYFMFRDGGSGAGDLYFYQYNTSTTSWGATAGTTAGLLIDGKNSSPNTMNAYWFGLPAFTSDWDGAGTGYMYLGWVWRRTSGVQTNQNPSAARWDGTSWTQLDGTSQTVPITWSNGSVLVAIAENESLSTFSACGLDSDDNFHLCWRRDDASDDEQIYHAVYDSGLTVNQVTTTGNGRLSGTDMIIDKNDRVIIIVKDTSPSLGLYVHYADAPDWDSWSKELLTVVPAFWDSVTTNGTTSFDRHQWLVNGVYEAFFDQAFTV